METTIQLNMRSDPAINFSRGKPAPPHLTLLVGEQCVWGTVTLGADKGHDR